MIERGDSVLEQMFWHMLLKTGQRWHLAVDQFRIGPHRVDCLIECEGKIVVIELDGKTFHNVEADKARDAILLKSVDHVVRVPFAAMWYYRFAVFEILRQWFPRFTLPAVDISTLQVSELQTEIEQIEGEEALADYFATIEDSYSVWDVDGDFGVVGSPSGFMSTSRLVHTIRRQDGKAADGMLDALRREFKVRGGIDG